MALTLAEKIEPECRKTAIVKQPRQCPVRRAVLIREKSVAEHDRGPARLVRQAEDGRDQMSPPVLKRQRFFHEPVVLLRGACGDYSGGRVPRAQASFTVKTVRARSSRPKVVQVAAWTAAEPRGAVHVRAATTARPNVPRLSAPTCTIRQRSMIVVSAVRYGPRFFWLATRLTASVIGTKCERAPMIVCSTNPISAIWV